MQFGYTEALQGNDRIFNNQLHNIYFVTLAY